MHKNEIIFLNRKKIEKKDDDDDRDLSIESLTIKE